MPYRTLDNRIDGVVITFMDITTAKELEAELRANEREMRALFQNMTNGFVLFKSVFEADGSFSTCRYIFVNLAYERITGIRHSKVEGKTVDEAWTGWKADWTEAFGRVVVSGKPESIEIQHPPSGKWFLCNVYRPGESRVRFCMILEEMDER